MREIPQNNAPALPVPTVNVPVADDTPKESALQVPPRKPGRKHGKKSELKNTDQRSSTFARAAGPRNARKLPTRQMNNRGGR